ncbi:hypothetical protein F5884DRAFT_743624 [Xylogone sp. PMI_703]|nr:hypothetical protein F5884DRAFT_743624 [Xylogone sp. PMI_703]
MPVLRYPSTDSPSSSTAPSFLSNLIHYEPHAANNQQEWPESDLTITTITSSPHNEHQYNEHRHVAHIFRRSSSVSSATVGIIVGVLIGSLLLVGVGYIWWLRARQWRTQKRRRRRRRKSKESTESGAAPAEGAAAPAAPT